MNAATTMLSTLFGKKATEAPVVPASDHESQLQRTASDEKAAELNGGVPELNHDDNPDLQSPTSTSNGTDEKSEEGHMFHGVAEMEAITTQWSTKAMICAYILIYLNNWAMSMLSMTESSLVPYVTSSFDRHGLLSATNVVSSIVGGVCRLPIAKIIDIWGRVEGFLLMLLIMVVGLIMMATCQNVETYAAAEVFYRIGYNGIGYVVEVYVADTSSLRNRALIMAVNSTPYLATAFAGPAAAQRFVEHAGWRWGFGVFAIVIPIVCLPLAFLFLRLRNQARANGLTQKLSSGRTFWQSTKFYFYEFDVIGMILIIAGWSLILLPLTIATYQAEQWRTPDIIAMIIIGGLCLMAFVAWEKWFTPVSFLPFNVLTDRTVLCASLESGCLFVASACWSTYFNSFLQVALFMSISGAGNIGNIYSLGSCVWAFVVGALIRYTNRYKWVAMASAPLVVLTSGLFVKYRQPGSTTGDIVGTQILMTISAAALVVCEQIAVMSAAPHANVAVVLALLSLFTNVGYGIGYGISGALWTNIFPKKLAQGLPGVDAETVAEIYGSLVVQQSYPAGSAIREGINWAYGEAMKAQSIAALVATCLIVPLVACWRNYNVRDTRRTKGRVM